MVLHDEPGPGRQVSLGFIIFFFFVFFYFCFVDLARPRPGRRPARIPAGILAIDVQLLQGLGEANMAALQPSASRFH